jgi:hypothetical protein
MSIELASERLTEPQWTAITIHCLEMLELPLNTKVSRDEWHTLELMYDKFNVKNGVLLNGEKVTKMAGEREALTLALGSRSLCAVERHELYGQKRMLE